MAIAILNRIAESVKDLDATERLAMYGAYREIERSLKDTSRDNGLNYAKINEELLRYRLSIEVLCDLEGSNSHSESQHISWMYGAVRGLESDMCFGQHMDIAS